MNWLINAFFTFDPQKSTYVGLAPTRFRRIVVPFVFFYFRRITEDYRVHLIMDNLPAATKMIREMPDGKTIVMYDRGECS